MRILATLVMVPFAAACLWFGGKVFVAMAAFSCLLLIFEWTRLVDGAEFSHGFYILSATAIVAFFLSAGSLHGWALIICLLGGIVGAAVEKVQGSPSRWLWMGAIYVVMPCLLLVWIRELPEGRALVMILFAAVWMTDIGAYTIGKLVGGPKFVPQISPAKTWSGTLGGIAAGIISVVLLSFVVFEPDRPLRFLIVGIALSVATVTGDIVESAVKRRFGVKDSGGYIPGHGGLLDRLDGMLLATLMMALTLWFWGTSVTS